MTQQEVINKLLKSLGKHMQPALLEEQRQILQQYLKYAYVAGHESGLKFSSRHRDVVQVGEFGKIIQTFHSAAKAGRKVSDSPHARSNIIKCCQGRRSTYMGYKWFYAENHKQSA